VSCTPALSPCAICSTHIRHRLAVPMMARKARPARSCHSLLLLYNMFRVLGLKSPITAVAAAAIA
jgi:hypothetical protein